MHVLSKKPAKEAKPKTARPRALEPAPVETARGKASSAAVAVPDKLDEFARMANEIDPMRALMLMFWKYRHQDPAFTINLSAEDLTGFEDCVNYLEVKPQIRVFRPQGMPASAGAPATETRSAIPPRPAGKPKDYVVIQLLDEDGNCIVPIENNESDLRRQEEARRLNVIRTNAPQIAAQLIDDLQANTTSSSTIMEAAEALKLLASA